MSARDRIELVLLRRMAWATRRWWKNDDATAERTFRGEVGNLLAEYERNFGDLEGAA